MQMKTTMDRARVHKSLKLFLPSLSCFASFSFVNYLEVDPHDYVFALSRSADSSTIAAALSNRTVVRADQLSQLIAKKKCKLVGH